MCCCKSLGRLSRLGVLCGVGAFAALLAAFLGGSWLHTREPITLLNSQTVTSVKFQIGLWKVCHQVKKVNGTSVPNPKCFSVKYSGWSEIRNEDIGMTTGLDLAQVFISRMRSCTVLCGMAVGLLLLALLFAMVGHCNGDNKTIIACGLFILGGLSLGTGLVVFASSLSETLMEISQYHKEPPTGPLYDYRYGWCFFTAGIAFIMTNMAAVFSISGYLNRFSSVDEMVRQMVPGAERKLREHQHLSTEYLVKHSGPVSTQYDSLTSERPKYEAECGPLLNKTPPDVCTTNKCHDFTSTEDVDNSCMMSNLVETSYSVAQTLAGQTVPITIKNCNSTAPLSFSNLPIKYGTMHFDSTRSQCAETLHQGFLGISDLGSSSSTSSSGYCGKSKTLQLPKTKRKCANIETFQVPETSFDFGKRTAGDFSFSGSAV